MTNKAQTLQANQVYNTNAHEMVMKENIQEQ